MSKKTNILSYKIEIIPRSLGDYGFMITSDYAFGRKHEDVIADYKERCEEMKNQIKRHVDNIGSIDIVSETETVCEFCDSIWSEGDSPHNGGCCVKDCEIMDLEND